MIDPALDASIVDVPAVSSDSFHNLGIAPQILKSLDYYGFVTPTPIQRDSIPVVATGVDVIGIAQTGTGKTLAFGIPTIQQLMLQGGKALIVVPTRELALQVEESLSKILRPLHLFSVVLIGGEHISRQIRALKQGADIIVATPGRLNDHLNQKTVSLNEVRIVILDEADRMLDMGFAPQIAAIMSHVPKQRQTLLFSATMPDEILHMTALYQKEPVRVEVARAGTASAQITQELIIVPKPGKITMLQQLLAEREGSTLVFSRTKHGARQLTRALNDVGVKAQEIHSDRSLSQRRHALDSFKAGRCRVLVATDIAARGIDVTGIELVVNYDLPDNPDDYVHRIGRTGRAGALGHAISFATPDQGKEVRAIERLARVELPRSPHSQSELFGTPERQVRQQRTFRRERPQHFGAPRDGFTPSADRPAPANRSDRPFTNDRPPRNDRPSQGGQRPEQNRRPDRDRQASTDTFNISAPNGFISSRAPRRQFRRK